MNKPVIEKKMGNTLNLINYNCNFYLFHLLFARAFKFTLLFIMLLYAGIRLLL